MVYDAGKKLTRKEIDLFRDAEDIRQITFLGTRLADERCKYDPKRVAEYASRQGHAQKLGYLVDITLQACKKLCLTKNTKRLEELINLLSQHVKQDYTFLFPYSNNEFDRRLQRWVFNESTTETHKKWHIYSGLKPSDAEEYLELYLIDLRQGNYVRYGPDTIKSASDYEGW